MSSSERLALAVDLGTTTIAASLLDLAGGARLAAAGALNPQRDFGADVVSRLDAACASADALQRMASLVNAELERLAGELLKSAGKSWESLATVAVAANPAMEHLLLGLPVTSLAFPPYRPVFSSGRTINTRDFGWGRGVEAFIFPLPGGFVGGDLVAFLFASGESLHPSQGARLFLDMGTNGEIALVDKDRIFATSAAAGPAFEGGNLACGMAALPGALSAVAFDGDKITLNSIGGHPPLGICGSAVIDTIAGLVRNGVLDTAGRLRDAAEIPSNLANRLTAVAGEPVFVLYRDAQRLIYLSQQDVRQVQLAKAALRAGIEVLLERSGICWESVLDVVLTGSFGARLAPEELKNIGILPGKMVEICSFVREGALAGVERAIATPGGWEAVDRLAAAIKVIPLSGTPAFEKHFLEQIDFPQV